MSTPNLTLPEPAQEYREAAHHWQKKWEATQRQLEITVEALKLTQRTFTGTFENGFTIFITGWEQNQITQALKLAEKGGK